MRLLLDTHLLLWSLDDSARLPAKARAIIVDADNELLFSPISIAETAIKYALGRPDFPISPMRVRDTLLANGFSELVLTGVHAATLALLPPIHKDPFDRLLLAQARAEGVPLLTGDRAVARYVGLVEVV